MCVCQLGKVKTATVEIIELESSMKFSRGSQCASGRDDVDYVFFFGRKTLT